MNTGFPESCQTDVRSARPLVVTPFYARVRVCARARERNWRTRPPSVNRPHRQLTREGEGVASCFHSRRPDRKGRSHAGLRVVVNWSSTCRG
jgi:hypothetical protein